MMPAPVSAGEMSTPNSCRIISAAIEHDDDRGDVRQDAAERARALGALERVEPGAEVDVMLEALDADADDADERRAPSPRSAGPSDPSRTPSVLSVAQVQPDARPELGELERGEHRSAKKISTKVANPISRSGPLDQRTRGGERVAQHVLHRRAPRSARAMRAASHAMSAVGTTTSATSCQSAEDRGKTAATYFMSSIAEPVRYTAATFIPMEVLMSTRPVVRTLLAITSLAFLVGSTGSAQQSTAKPVKGGPITRRARRVRSSSASRAATPATWPTATAAPARWARWCRRATTSSSS